MEEHPARIWIKLVWPNNNIFELKRWHEIKFVKLSDVYIRQLQMN